MPELTFTTRWPDGATLESYSPSLVVHDHLEVGRAYPVAELVERVATALTLASERVEARWGHPCTAAHAALAAVRQTGREQPDGLVVVESIDPPAASR